MNARVETTQPLKRQRMESNHGNNQESSQSLNMIFYSNPTVKSEPNTHTTQHTHSNVYMNSPNIKLEQTLPNISADVSQHSLQMLHGAGAEQERPSGHFQVGGTQVSVAETPATQAPVHQPDNQIMLRLKPSNDLLNQAKILENKTLGLWMCSVCTFTHPGLTIMQSHIQTQHF
eukprot:GFUD01065762.1.p1 GENE.GFUD01065762.1~~GFUD01065762.1.p1  ORF type:complete len:174 (+),score=39.52 GFUD01065762.1:1-522(+)